MQRTKQTDGSRRYPKSKQPVYHRTYNRLAKDSTILNDAKRANDFYNSNALFGISECKGTLLQLEGLPEKDQMYQQNNTWYLALIPSAEDQLKRVKKKFKRWQKQQVEKGHALKPPKQWPSDLLEERLKAEALCDVRYAEKSKVEARIKELKVKKQKERKEPILPDGPVGNFKGGGDGSHDGPLKSVDGQNISFSPSGIPYISEPDTPYDGMAVAYYRTMSKVWKKENRITRQDLIERKNEFIKAKEEAGKEVPPNLSWKKFESMLKRNGEWPENPDWPSDVKPITEIEKEVKTEGSDS